jgi:hypothetical protein
LNKNEYIIKTFTMSADLGEDRIRLDAVDGAGVLQAIWITRRLADRFLPHLGADTEKQVQSGLPRDLVLSMNHEQLRSERAANPPPAVKVQPAITPWLCRTIRLKERPQDLIWTMTDDATIDAHMVLDGNNIGALLDIFLNSYRKLEWSEDAFPEWLRERTDAGRPRAGLLN